MKWYVTAALAGLALLGNGGAANAQFQSRLGFQPFGRSGRLTNQDLQLLLAQQVAARQELERVSQQSSTDLDRLRTRGYFFNHGGYFLTHGSYFLNQGSPPPSPGGLGGLGGLGGTVGSSYPYQPTVAPVVRTGTSRP